MSIQSINFDSSLKVTGASGSTKSKTDKKNTPLLDNAQVDSDHE